MNKTKAAADLVLRYLTARALYRQNALDMPPNLETLISRGVRSLACGVLINEIALKPSPAILYDRKDPRFWAAIIGGERGAIDMDPAEQEEVRQLVLIDDWTWPVLPSDSRPGAIERMRRFIFGEHAA